jgi:hypothetical protein
MKDKNLQPRMTRMTRMRKHFIRAIRAIRGKTLVFLIAVLPWLIATGFCALFDVMKKGKSLNAKF